MYGTPEGVLNIVSIDPQDLGLRDEEEKTAEEKLDELLEKWLQEISSAINTRLVQGEVEENDPKYYGLVNIAERKVSDMVSLAIQKSTSPVIQIDDFAVQILNSSEVLKNIGQELKDYQERRVSVFSSADTEEEE